MSEERGYRIGFSVAPDIGPVRFGRLVARFGCASDAWKATAKDLQDVLGVKLGTEFARFRTSFDLPAYLALLRRLKISALMPDDAGYPPLLKEIPDMPYVLYVRGRRGSTPINMRRTVGIVGTRHPTAYGISITRTLSAGLAQAGVTVVSGMAYGIDAVAHESALAAGGNTVAVLGCGVDIPAPSGNAHIYASLIAGGHGAVVGEMPLGLRPAKCLFPVRNRLISGMSLGVVVTEGARASGSMITARYAAEQGRDVLAVPGPADSEYSHGPAFLLKQGAILVESVSDILDALALSAGKNSGKSAFSL